MVLNRNPPPARKPAVRRRDNLGFVTLYLDDLDALLRALHRAEPNYVSIEAGEAVADEASDVKGLTPSELARLQVVTHGPDVQIRLTRRGASITSEGDDTDTHELHDRALSLLQTHKGGAGRFFLSQLVVPGWLGWLFVAAGVVTELVAPTIDSWTSWLFIGAGLFFAFFPAITNTRYAATTIGSARLVLRTRADARETTRDSRQRIAELVLTGILGALVGAVLTTWLPTLL